MSKLLFIELITLIFNMVFLSSSLADERLRVSCVNSNDKEVSFTFPVDLNFYEKQGYKNRNSVRISRKSATQVRVAEKSVRVNYKYLSSDTVYRFPKDQLFIDNDNNFEVKVSSSSEDDWFGSRYVYSCQVL